MITIDIDMPKNCKECPCLHWGEYGVFEKSWCALDGKIFISEKRRPFGCSLHKAEIIADKLTRTEVREALKKTLKEMGETKDGISD